MVLVIIIIIMIIGMGIVGSIYASIGPFIYQVGNTSNYNAAYYIALMNVERGLLALRYHDAGFEGTSGKGTGALADGHDLYGFSKFDRDPNADMSRTITSRSIGIPGTGNGNIESLMAGAGSENYNSLGYYEGLELPLYLDNTNDTNDYYTPVTNYIPIGGAGGSVRIEGSFRLPPKIQAGLNNEQLDDTTDVDSDNIYDDIVLNRGLKGYDTIDENDFNIIPTIRQNFALNAPIYEFDNALRESIINLGSAGDNINTEAGGFNTLGFHFGLPGDGVSSLLENHNILPLSSIQSGENFDAILNDVSLQSLSLNFNITNRMRTAGGNIYPFLEWRLRACDITCNHILPDRFYNLEGMGKIGNYTVRINIKKPVRETSNASNFTIIF